jgi:hypothetical protein
MKHEIRNPKQARSSNGQTRRTTGDETADERKCYWATPIAFGVAAVHGGAVVRSTVIRDQKGAVR